LVIINMFVEALLAGNKNERLVKLSRIDKRAGGGVTDNKVTNFEILHYFFVGQKTIGSNMAWCIV